MRIFKIENNPRLKELLETKKERVEETVAIQDTMQKMQTDLQEKAKGVQEVKDEIMLAAHETVMAECSDEEMPGTLTLSDEGEIEVEIYNVVEEQKKQTAGEKEKLNNRIIDLKRAKKKENPVKKAAKKKK